MFCFCVCLVDWYDCVLVDLVDWSIDLWLWVYSGIFGCIGCIGMLVCVWDGWIGEFLCWCGGALGVLA